MPSLGVVAFREGVPLFLGGDEADPSILRLRVVSTAEDVKERTLKSPRNGPATITALAFSREGTHAAAVVRPITATPPEPGGKLDPNIGPKFVGDTATLVVWEVATGAVVCSIEEKRGSQEQGVILSPDGALVAIWDQDGPLHDVAVWSVKEGTALGRFSTTRSAITSVAFGPDPVWREDVGALPWRLAVGEHGGMITVWDVHSRAVKCQARGSIHDVKTVDFSRDGAWLASAGRNELLIWDSSTGECVLRVPSGNFLPAVAFSPDDQQVAVAKSPLFGIAGGVDVYDLERGRGLRTLRGLQQRIEKVAVSLDSRRVAALSNDWEIGVFDRKSGALIGITEAPQGVFTDNAAIALNADGTRLVCSAGSEAKLWDVQEKRLLRKWKLPPALTEAAGFRPDGKLILIRQETKGGVVGPYGEFPAPSHPPRLSSL